MPSTPALDFLLSRRSRPARTLVAPVPDREEMMTLLTAAARSPDHGKLEPWRFIVLTKPAMGRLAALVRARGEALGLDPERVAKSESQYAMADLAVVVVASPKGTEKVPAIEQTYSAGAVCLALLNAATAAGWGANWLTGWPVYDEAVLRDGFGVEAPESVVGVVHIGTPRMEAPDRPRPDVSRLTTWVEA
jgi:nitroreductase